MPRDNFITYTNCEDILPHDEHDLSDDGTYICIGKQYGPPPMRPDYPTIGE